MFSKKKKVDQKTKKKIIDDKHKAKPQKEKTPIKKPATNVIPRIVEPKLPNPKFGYGRITSNIKPLVFSEDVSEKPPVIPRRTYPNRKAHPEYQDINLTAGYHSALMKQHEINEELLRALIDIQIGGLPEVVKEEMLKKYGGLI